MIEVKYVNKENLSLAEDIGKDLSRIYPEGVEIKPAQSEDLAAPGGAFGLEEIILDIVLSKVVEFGLEKLYRFIKDLIKKKNKEAVILIKVKVNGETVFADKFKLNDPEQDMEAFEYQVNEAAEQLKTSSE